MNKNLIIAVAVFVLLLVVVLALRSQPEKVGVKELKVEAIDKDKVSKIEITLPPKQEPKEGPDAGPAKTSSGAPTQVVLEKEGGEWKVYDPAQPSKKMTVEPSQIDAALSAVGEFKTGDLISNKGDKLAELEIDDAHGHRVKISGSDGKGLDLLFGRAAKGGGSTVRSAGSDDVFVAKGRLGATLKKELSQWRKKTLVDVKADEFASVTVKPESGAGFTVTSSTPAPTEMPDGGVADAPKPEWKLTEPATLPAGFRVDSAQLSRAAQGLAAVRAQDFAEPTGDDVTGFGGAHSIVEGTTKDGKKVVLHFGKEDDKKRVFAKVDGDAQLYLVASYTAKQAARSLDDLRDLSLVDAKLDDVTRVTFRGSKGTAVVARDGAAWKLVEPKTPPADFELSQVETQVGSLLRMRATKLAAADAKATGLDKPGPVIEIQLKDGKKQLVRFGAGLPVEDQPAAGPAKDAKKAPAPEPREFFVKGGVDELTYVIAGFTRKRYDNPTELFKKPPTPPQGLGQGGGSIPGLENLPPDVRRKLQESLKKAH